MFSSAVRTAPRRALALKLPLRPRDSGRFLSTAPPSQKSRSWKSSAARWAIAGAGVYYYNTSSVFAEQPDGAIARLDESIHHVQESKLPTVDAIIEEKHRRQALRQDEEAKVSKAVASQDGVVESEQDLIDDLEEEADQQGAFNPETGEINWDCPCLGGMAHGPCGPEFKEAFSCFIYSTEEPKGMECIEKFKGMQDCFRQHPEMYGSELEEDEDDVEEELRADPAATPAGDSEEAPAAVESQPQVSKVVASGSQSTTLPQNPESRIQASASGEHQPNSIHELTTK